MSSDNCHDRGVGIGLTFLGFKKKAVKLDRLYEETVFRCWTIGRTRLLPSREMSVRWIIGLNVKAKIIKLLERNIEYLCGVRVGKDFLEDTESINYKRKE